MQGVSLTAQVLREFAFERELPFQCWFSVFSPVSFDATVANGIVRHLALVGLLGTQHTCRNAPSNGRATCRPESTARPNISVIQMNGAIFGGTRLSLNLEQFRSVFTFVLTLLELASVREARAGRLNLPNEQQKNEIT